MEIPTGTVRRTGAAALVVALMATLAACGGAKREGATYSRLLQVVEYVDVELPAVDPAPTLTGPHFKITITGRRIATESREFSTVLQRLFPNDSYLPAKAAPGAELIVVGLGIKPHDYTDGKAADLVKIQVTAGTDQVAVPALRDGQFVAVATKVGQPVTVVVTDDGRQQSLDLRTGSPGPDVVPELQQPPEQKLDGPTTTVNGMLSAFGSRRPYTVVVRPALAERRVYRPDLRWAPQGKAWLFFSMKFTSNSIPENNAPIPFWVRQEFDLTKVASLTLTDGTKVPGMRGRYVHDGSLGFEVHFTVHFEVPAGTKAGTVTVNLGGTVTAVISQERTQQVRYSPSPASITVPVALPS
jgi:hypothetical protein